MLHRDHHKPDVNGVYHRPSRPISQQHVGIPPRDQERGDAGECIQQWRKVWIVQVEERMEVERQCVRETSRV